MSMPGIFISYRRSDSPDATGRLYDRLVAGFGKARVFKAYWRQTGRWPDVCKDPSLASRCR